MNAISVKNVSYKYGNSKRFALKSVSLDVREGEFVALLGGNGSGKSTLAKHLNGLFTPTSGNVTVFGVDTADEKSVFDVRTSVGMVFQNPDNQMVASVIEDDIAFGPENVGLPREEIEQRIDWALNAVGMDGYRTRAPFKLSGGQKQRIAIAGVLALRPRAIVLDESTAMLDPKGRAEVMKVIKQLNKENGMTVILITHFMEEALEADRVVVMSEGEIVLSGSPREVFADRQALMRAKLALPPTLAVADMLREGGMPIGEAWTDEELVEEVCRLL